MNPAQLQADPRLRAAVERTRSWVEHAVIGLNLCPFAKGPHVRGLVRYAASAAESEAELLLDLQSELALLLETPAEQIETSLLIHPFVLNEFPEYNDFLDQVDTLLRRLRLRGVIQVASFHPHYQFGGTAVGDLANATNWSPHPLLHLLREASVERAAESVATERILDDNQARLAELGAAGWQALQQRWQVES